MRPHFIDGFYDSFSCELRHSRGHALSASRVGPRIVLMVLIMVLLICSPLDVLTILLMIIALILLLELLFCGMLLRVIQGLLK